MQPIAMVLDEQAAHYLGGRGNEAAAAVPARFLDTLTSQPHIHHVYKCRWLQRLPRCLLSQRVRCKAAQLAIQGFFPEL